MQSAFVPSAFSTSTSRPKRRVSRRPRILASSGKGFGKQPAPEKKDAKPSFAEPPSANTSKPFVPRGPTLRAEYERKGIIEPSVSPDAGVLPEIVANRMIRRIAGFAGVPLLLLFAFFTAYFVLKYKYDITVIPAIVAYSTLGTIAMAGIGITYGIFSSSWDEDIEGTALGWEEATTNLLRAKDGLFGARQREIQEEEFDKIDRRAEERNRSIPKTDGQEDDQSDE